MATRAPKISVATGDYSLVRGVIDEDVSAASQAVLALRSRRGSGAVASWFGSRLHTIRKLTRAAKPLAEMYAREALQFLVDRGAVRDLVVIATVSGGIRLLITYRDRGGQRRTIDYTHSVTA